MAEHNLLVSKSTGQLIGYGLCFAGAAIVGKLMIDNLVGEMDDAKTRREFIGPIQEAPKVKSPEVHVALSDCVRFGAMIFSIYSMLAQAPKLIEQWGTVQKNAEDLLK